MGQSRPDAFPKRPVLAQRPGVCLPAAHFRVLALFLLGRFLPQCGTPVFLGVRALTRHQITSGPASGL